MDPRDQEHYIDRIIRKAREVGEFDNLPGKGKPFTHLDTDPLGQVLQAQGFVPRWLELDQDIQHKIEIAEQSVKRSWEWARQTWSSGSAADQRFAESEWQEAQRVFGERLEEINKLITILNLELPPALRHLQKIPLKLQDQLQRLGLSDRLA